MSSFGTSEQAGLVHLLVGEKHYASEQSVQGKKTCGFFLHKIQNEGKF